MLGRHYTIPTLTATELERFWAKVDKTDSCWNWTAACNQAGYGKFSIGKRPHRKQYTAHRITYTLEYGDPQELVIDHICRNPACVNPTHLDAVTQQDNVLRGNGIGAWCAQLKHCPHGHEYSPENTYIPPDGKGRWCKECVRNRSREYQRKLAPQRKATTSAGNATVRP